MIIERKGTANCFSTYNNQSLSKCRYVWMISPHIPTTCQPALLAEVLTWVPLPPACLFETANCALLVSLCLLSSKTLKSYVINGPSYPPHVSILMYHDSLMHQSIHFFSKIPAFRYREKLFPLYTLNVVILLARSADRVSWKQTLTHTHTHMTATKITKIDNNKHKTKKNSM